MRIKVYQVENDLDSKGVKFCSYDSALKLASVIDTSIYECVFDGNIDANGKLTIGQLGNAREGAVKAS